MDLGEKQFRQRKEQTQRLGGRYMSRMLKEHQRKSEWTEMNEGHIRDGGLDHRGADRPFMALTQYKMGNHWNI